MRILLSNDDGYLAPGLQHLHDALASLGEITVVAPEQDRSGASNSLTLDRPLSVRRALNGFYFVNGSDPDVLPNPCVEIALNPKLIVTSREIEKLRAYGSTGHLEDGMELWGWQMCNLSTVSGAAADTQDQFFALARAAARIGSVQATDTDIPYLGPVTRVINEREALIGVSICCVPDNPEILLDPATLRRGAEVVKAVNAAAAIAAASAWFDHRWPLPDAVRWTVPAALAALAVFRAHRAVRVFRARAELAARYLDARGGGGRTLNAYELAAARDRLPGSAELAAAEIRAVEAFWSARAVPVPPIARPALALLACLLCACLLYTSPSPRDRTRSRMPSSA